jgi:hypothetical protein
MRNQTLHRKWMHIYNSIVRLKFYNYLEINGGAIMDDLDKQFTDFVASHLGIHEKGLRFFGGNTLVSFAYLILVRMNEVLKSELSPEDVKQVFSDLDWKIIEVDGFSELQTKYKINMVTLVEVSAKGKKYYTNDMEKLRHFIRKLRNSVSHNNYDHPDEHSIRLFDIEPHSKTMEMDVVMPYADFLNFCADIGIIVHETVRKQYFN